MHVSHPILWRILIAVVPVKHGHSPNVDIDGIFGQVAAFSGNSKNMLKRARLDPAVASERTIVLFFDAYSLANRVSVATVSAERSGCGSCCGA